jgi:Ca2+-binding EF-hand superfamily protein
MNVLVKMLDTKQVKELQIMFQKIDTDNTGYIEANELAEAIKNSNADIDHDEITRIIKEIDYHGNEKINYSEFIAATISV